MPQIWTPLQPASMPDDSLEGLKSWYAPLGRIGQVNALDFAALLLLRSSNTPEALLH